jgi:hemoglobin
MQETSAETLYEAIGGEQTVRMLVESFYPKVYNDPDLSLLFLDEMESIMEKQRLFLTQFTGGPPLYSIQFGPPQMRQRHLDFEVTPLRAKAWLRCMEEAMVDIGLSGHVRERFFAKLTQVAEYMVNTKEG